MRTAIVIAFDVVVLLWAAWNLRSWFGPSHRETGWYPRRSIALYIVLAAEGATAGAALALLPHGSPVLLVSRVEVLALSPLMFVLIVTIPLLAWPRWAIPPQFRDDPSWLTCIRRAL